ncbi:MAG: LysR family transcriptional regulator, partial [Pseudomonadota bacterium]
MLNTLVMIADSGSFQTVARVRNMTLSAVSAQMKALEASLGVSLFDRSCRPPRLTAIGREVVERAREVVAAEERLLVACARRDHLRGHLRLGVVLSASVRLLPGFLARCRDDAPDVTVSVRTGLSRALLADVRAGRLDLAVLTLGNAPEPELLHDVLRDEALVYAFPRDIAGHIHDRE